MADFTPCFVPCSYEDFQYFDSKLLTKNSTSWNYFITPKAPGEYCFKLIPKFNMSNNFHQVIRFSTYPHSYPVNELISFEQQYKNHQIKSVIQQISSSNFLIINENSNSILLFSTNNYRSFFIVPLYSISPSQYSVFSDHFNTFAFNFNTNKSLIYSNGLSYQLDECIIKAIDWSQNTSSVACLSLRTGKIFIQKLSEEINFLSDQNHQNFLYINETNERIISSEFVSINSDSLSLIVILINEQKEYEIRYLSVTQLPNYITFPHYIYNKTYNYENPQSFNRKFIKQTKNLQPIVINGLQHLNKNYPQFLLYYGNFLAISSSYGNIPYLTMTFENNETITKIISSSFSSKFAFLTNKNNLFFGDVFSNKYNHVKIDNSSKDIVIEFDENDILNVIDMNNITNIKHYTYDNNYCETNIQIKSFEISKFSRIKIPKNINNFIPSHIYLYSNKSFILQISLKTNNENNDLIIYNSEYVIITKNKFFDYYNNLLIFNVSIQQNQNIKIASKSRVELFLKDVNPQCEHFHTSIEVTCGYVPNITFNYQQQNVHNKEKIDIIPFYKKWKPEFYIYDEILNTKTLYKGLYKLELIGSGETLEKIKLFKNITKINFGDYKRIWSYETMKQNLYSKYKNNSIQWICQKGSKCGKTSKFSDPTKIYLMFKVTSIPNNEEGIYCSFSSNFVILLSNIPMNINIMKMFLCVSFAFCLIVFFICYLFRNKLMFINEPIKLISIDKKLS